MDIFGENTLLVLREKSQETTSFSYKDVCEYGGENRTYALLIVNDNHPMRREETSLGSKPALWTSEHALGPY